MLMIEEWGACSFDGVVVVVVDFVACEWLQSQCRDWVEVARRGEIENYPPGLCTLAALMVVGVEEGSPN